MNQVEIQKFYRYEISVVSTGSSSFNGDYDFIKSNTKVKLTLLEFNLFKETPKGYWIGYGSLQSLHSPEKWVSKTSKKRYAYPTKKEALNNFIKRTKRRYSILQSQLNVCEDGLKLAKDIEETINNKF